MITSVFLWAFQASVWRSPPLMITMLLLQCRCNQSCWCWCAYMCECVVAEAIAKIIDCFSCIKAVGSAWVSWTSVWTHVHICHLDLCIFLWVPWNRQSTTCIKMFGMKPVGQPHETKLNWDQQGSVRVKDVDKDGRMNSAYFMLLNCCMLHWNLRMYCDATYFVVEALYCWNWSLPGLW